MNGYITVQEAAEKWGVTPRQVQILCKENRIAYESYLDYPGKRREADKR